MIPCFSILPVSPTYTLPHSHGILYTLVMCVSVLEEKWRSKEEEIRKKNELGRSGGAGGWENELLAMLARMTDRQDREGSSCALLAGAGDSRAKF